MNPIFRRTSKLLITIAAVLLLNVDSEKKDSFSTEPILRIETGMHTAKIGRIAMDAKQKYLVTASDDKTIRVWDLESPVETHGRASLRQIQIIRPPIGEGNEGKLYAVAISPDGNTIVAGGWTGDWSKNENDYTIYFFNRQTGKMIQKIDGMENVIGHLLFSPNGKHLVANLGAGAGVRLMDNKSGVWKLIGSDTEYGSDSYGSSFSPDGKVLVTTCLDGKIRLYRVGLDGDTDWKPVDTVETKGGKQPFSVAFSPEGTEIAIGYNDSTALDVYALKTNASSKEVSLEYSYSPDTKDADNGNLMSLAYSGEFLYAGGMFYKDGNFPIRRWEKQGKGKYGDLVGSSNTIMHILPFSKSGIVYGTYDPAIGAYNDSGKRIFFQGSAIADYRGLYEKFLVSKEADSLSFNFEYDGVTKTFASFAFKNRKLSVGESKDFNLKSPLIQSDKFAVTGWLDTYYPQLNDNPIPLMRYEISRSLAIHPKEETFLLGTEWYLRYFDKSGKELWSNPVPGVAWAVNISGDGRFALAAFGDGTIRWYRIEDGKELLAFFPHADKKRWVLWTLEGYYDASIGGEELIGWHINRAKDKESDFFPVSKFRDRFYRPDIISKVLEFADTGKAIAEANEEMEKVKGEFQSKSFGVSKSLPAVTTIVSPNNYSYVDTNEVDIEVEIRSPSLQKITKIKTYIDDKFLSSQTVDFTPKDKDETKRIKYTIGIAEKNKTEVSIITETEKGIPSESSNLTLLFGKAGKEIKPDLYILSIGVGKYKDKGVNTLHYTTTDAKEFFDLMKKQEGVVFGKVNIEEKSVLLDEGATREEILESISALRGKATVNDVTIVFLSGHGRSEADNLYYFLPHDYNKEKPASSGLSGADLMNQLANVKGRVILFMDACYSGSLTTGALNFTRFINEAKDPNKRFVVFASSTKYETSLESDKWKNGAFTKALKEAILEGKGEHPNKKITLKSLDAYISRRVPELTDNKQMPVSEGTGRDFTIAVKK